MAPIHFDWRGRRTGTILAPGNGGRDGRRPTAWPRKFLRADPAELRDARCSGDRSAPGSSDYCGVVTAHRGVGRESVRSRRIDRFAGGFFGSSPRPGRIGRADTDRHAVPVRAVSVLGPCSRRGRRADSGGAIDGACRRGGVNGRTHGSDRTGRFRSSHPHTASPEPIAKKPYSAAVNGVEQYIGTAISFDPHERPAIVRVPPDSAFQPA